jgi:hypothetical protein
MFCVTTGGLKAQDAKTGETMGGMIKESPRLSDKVKQCFRQSEEASVGIDDPRCS